MKRIVAGAILAGGMLLGTLALPADAAPWAHKVTGEATMANPYPGLTVSLSAWEGADGADGGQLQYEFWDGDTLVRKWHVTAEAVCFSTTTGGQAYATAIGPVDFQEGTSFAGKTYAGVSVLDNSNGPDRLRAGHFADRDDAMGWKNQCATQTANGDFPATVAAGGYEIKSK